MTACAWGTQETLLQTHDFVCCHLPAAFISQAGRQLKVDLPVIGMFSGLALGDLGQRVSASVSPPAKW